MRIGIIIGRIGGVDGVALETEKWIEVLKKLDHEVFIMSGEFEFWIWIMNMIIFFLLYPFFR